LDPDGTKIINGRWKNKHTMIIATIIAILRALWLWPFLAIVFAGLVLTGVAHGPWNYCWFFAMACWLVLDAYWALGAHTTRPVITPGQLRLAVFNSFVVHTLYCLPLSSVPLLGWQILPHSTPLEIFGAFVCAAGVAFAIWSRRVMAGNWNATVVLQERHALVQTGPYAIVRHPIYLGFLLTAIGMFLALGEVRALACLWHVAQFFKKMKSEEDILQAAYPDEYPDYERRVKRLAPCIW
jgi:protein-S-isoprenylcysteine O-methyltransferase Ste14